MRYVDPHVAPRIAPRRVTTAAPRAVRIPVRVAVSGVTGIRGKLCRLARMSHWEPAIAVTIARMIAMTMAHSQTAIPCLTPLNRAIRPAT
jgi:hypothetical protein